MPTMDEGDIIISVEKLPSISLDQPIAINARLQAAIMAKVPEVTGIVARTGSDELGLDPMGLNQTDTFLVLKPRISERRDKEWLIEAAAQVLADFPGSRSASPNRSTCACRRCSPACAATWR